MGSDHTRQTRAGADPTPTVLVVDDDAGIRDLLEIALEEEGYRVYTAVDGAALQLAHDRQPALILLDLMMPGMDGFEVSQRLRADPATAHIPIIVMSALLPSRSVLLPVNDRLSKPFTLVARWTAAA
jgi:CheY-like chemotaxis protein